MFKTTTVYKTVVVGSVLVAIIVIIAVSISLQQSTVDQKNVRSTSIALAGTATANHATCDMLLSTIEAPTITPLPSQTPNPTYTPYPTCTPIISKNPQTSGPVRIGKLTGTYSVSYSNGAGSILKVIHETSDEPIDRLRFELYCNRGAPSFNSGVADGIILVSGDTAVYNTCYEIYGPCSIVFRFSENAVEVTQIGGAFDCGFGHAVYADGVYELVDHNVPELECEKRESNPCK